MDKHYSVGLDIGTNSIGWTVVDDNGHVMKARGKLGIGVRMFNAGTPAAERRTFRTTRRRLSRRRWRMRLLRELFDAQIAAIDSDFFRRLKYFGEAELDANKHSVAHRLFTNRTDADFYNEYPTIYHLRYHLMNDDRKFDLREIYLAIAHIIKYRGHFLTQGLAVNMVSGVLDVSIYLTQMNAAYQDLLRDESFALPTDDETVQSIKTLILDRSISRKDRAAQIAKLLTVTVRGDKARMKQNTDIAKAIGSALVGLKLRLDRLVQTTITKPEQSDWTKAFDNIDDFLATHEDQLDGNTQNTIIELTQKLYMAGMLTDIVPEGKTLSEGMIAKYDAHAEDLKALKEFARTQDRDTAMAIMALYDKYIHGEATKPFAWEDFVKQLKKYLSKENTALAKGMLARIDQGIFMPKQRTKLNANIPNQIQQQELDQIIENQGRFYPFLKALNPVVAHRMKGNKPWLKYQLDELLSFRIPYHAGPMITPDAQHASSKADFAWMVLNPGQTAAGITPWNYAEKVDRKASATKFIERMRTTDTYLLGEEVLPQSSLIYQRFMVLNELQNVRINKTQHLTRLQRQRVFQQLFVQGRNKTVTLLQLHDNLLANSELQPDDEISGLADENKFLAQLGTYHDLKRIIPDAVDLPERQADIEAMIVWSTLFEEGTMFREKLADVAWLTDEQRDALAKIRYRGWGNLSKRLLTEIRDDQGVSIMDQLWQGNANFSKLVNQTGSPYQAAITAFNQDTASQESVEAQIDAQYTSPVNKKALRQVMLVLKELKQAFNGESPQYVYIESADGTTPQQKGKRTVSKGEQLQAKYAQMAADVVNEDAQAKLQEMVAHDQAIKDKYYLYFTQNGLDAYSGLPIDLSDESLSGYDIDHIIPQRLLKDDSFDNRVLVDKQINENWKAGDKFASREFGERMMYRWRQWQQAGLITERKLANLMFDPDKDPGRLMGFISRQLVETRQVIKLASQLISVQEPKTKIIRVTAKLTHAFRKDFALPKIREANDYHHAFDAYVAAFLGTYLHRQYPKLAGMFEYDNYLPFELSRFASEDTNFIGKLRTNDVLANADGELTWQRKVDEPEIRRIYDLKSIRVTQEAYEVTGGLFDQTIRPHGESTKLIPVKQGKDPQLYGGYQKPTAAFVSVIQITGKKTPTFKVVPIYLLDVPAIDRAKGAERQVLIKAAIDRFLTRQAKPGAKLPDYQIVVPRLRMGSKLRLPNGQEILIISSQMQRNAIQFYVSRHEQQRLDDAYKETDVDLTDLFVALITRAQQQLPLLAGHLQRVAQAQDKFEQLPVLAPETQLSQTGVIKALLNGLRPESSGVDWKKLMQSVTGYFGKFQSQDGIVLPEGTVIEFESVTGLFQHDRLIK